MGLRTRDPLAETARTGVRPLQHGDYGIRNSVDALEERKRSNRTTATTTIKTTSDPPS